MYGLPHDSQTRQRLNVAIGLDSQTEMHTGRPLLVQSTICLSCRNARFLTILSSHGSHSRRALIARGTCCDANLPCVSSVQVQRDSRALKLQISEVVKSEGSCLCIKCRAFIMEGASPCPVLRGTHRPVTQTSLVEGCWCVSHLPR